MFRSLLTLTLFVLAVMATNPAMSGSTSTPSPPTKLECSGAFADSSAASSCTMDAVRIAENMCSYDVRCRSTGSSTFDVSSTFSVGLGDAGKVVNCNGYLKVSSC